MTRREELRDPPSLASVVGSALLLVLVLFALVSALAADESRRTALYVEVASPDGGALYVEDGEQPARCVVLINADVPTLRARIDWCVDPVEYPMR